MVTYLYYINISKCWFMLTLRSNPFWDERSSPGSVFFGSPSKQNLPRQHLNVESPSMGNMLKIATSSSFSFAFLILSSPTVFVCRCNLLDSRSLNASVAIFSLKTFIQTNTRAFTGCYEIYVKRELAKTKLSSAFLYDSLRNNRNRNWSAIIIDNFKIDLRKTIANQF